MAFSATSAGHYSPQSGLPPLSYKVLNTGTWGANSNTCLITDEYIHPNSVVIAFVTGTSAQAAGRWSYLVEQGTCTITSSDSESSTLPITYIVI